MDEKDDTAGGNPGSSQDNTAIFVMNNYFGIGIDASLCLDFHNAREENPNKFNSRLVKEIRINRYMNTLLLPQKLISFFLKTNIDFTIKECM